MASPAKRRKKNNDSAASPSTTRSLDYFFGKQASSQGQKLSLDRGHDRGRSNHQAQSSEVAPSSQGHELADEELARQLQEQWANEDKQAAMIQPETSRPRSFHDNDDKMEDTSPKRIELDTSTELPASLPVNSDPKVNSHSETPSGLRTDTARPKTLSLQSNGTAEDTISATIPFDESPLTFQPSRYIEQLQQHWASEGGSASYALLTRCFVLVNSTQSRIKIVDNLVNLLRLIIEADPDSLLPAVWLATNSISPPYVSLELGLGGSAISKALKRSCGLDNSGLRALSNKYGDAGDVAFEAKKRQSFTLRKPKPLTIKGVYQSLVKIANSKGTGSQEIKQRIVDRLVQDSRGAEESRYIVRTLVQHVRDPSSNTAPSHALAD